MFCRFCGAHVLDDSIFCAKCGKRVGRAENPRLEKIIRVLHLRTPYPYAIFLFLVAAIWLQTPHAAPFDYSNLKWTFQVDRKVDIVGDNLYQQGMSLILENMGSKPIKEAPIELEAHIEPPQPAEISATFQGRRLPIMQAGKSMPLTVVLSDEIRPGTKRSFLVEGSIQAKPPFKVIYEIREQNSETVLTEVAVER
jgi:hypothetical protein